MNNEPLVQPDSPADGSKPVLAAAASSDAHSRRRLLLKGLGKGAAVVAAATPIQTLALPKLTGGPVRLCTVSGMQSNVGSRNPVQLTTATCVGYSPYYYGTPDRLSNWPATPFVAGGKSVSPAATFVSIFDGGSGNTLATILAITPPPNVTINAMEKVWVVALLNGQKLPASYPSQYTAGKVLELYADLTPTKGGTSTVRNDAYDFFSMYLQGVNA